MVQREVLSFPGKDVIPPVNRISEESPPSDGLRVLNSGRGPLSDGGQRERPWQKLGHCRLRHVAPKIGLHHNQ